MSSFLPEDLYPDSANCPAGRVLTVCWNPSDYSLGQGMGAPGKLKLENPSNFGASGTSKYGFTLKSFQPSEITKQRLIDEGCDIYQIGVAEHDASGRTFGGGALNTAQVSEIEQWAAMSSEHTVLSFQNYVQGFGGYGGAQSGASNPMTATELGDSFIKDGPFGDASTFSQGGGWKGVLTTLPADDTCVLMNDAANRPVIVLDRNYNSVFFSDVDIITQLGGLTEGSGITSTNDRLFGNLYAFLTGILCNGPPVDCYFYEDPFEMCNPPPATTTR